MYPDIFNFLTPGQKPLNFMKKGKKALRVIIMPEKQREEGKKIDIPF